MTRNPCVFPNMTQILGGTSLCAPRVHDDGNKLIILNACWLERMNQSFSKSNQNIPPLFIRYLFSLFPMLSSVLLLPLFVTFMNGDDLIYKHIVHPFHR